MGKGIGIAVSVIILVAALVVCLVPVKTVAYTVMVDYQEDEPYEATETYTETELEPQVEILEHHADREGDSFWVRGMVKNINDVVLATFDISIHARCPVKGVEDRFLEKAVVIDKPIAMQPGEVRNFEAFFPGDEVTGNYTLKINSPYTEKTVVKERVVTKYKQVTKQYPETRYKEVTLFDYFLHY